MAGGLSRLDKPLGRIIPPACQYSLRVLTGSIAVDRSCDVAGRRVRDLLDRLPPFITEIWSDPARLRTLLVAAASMTAAGPTPPVTSPALPTVQATIREQPGTNAEVLAITLIAAGLLFIGGILGDTDGRRGILLGALTALLVANVAGLVLADGPLLVVDRFV